MVEGLALVLVLQDVALGTGAQVAALGVGTSLRADSRRCALIQVLAQSRISRIENLSSWAGAKPEPEKALPSGSRRL